MLQTAKVPAGEVLTHHGCRPGEGPAVTWATEGPGTDSLSKLPAHDPLEKMFELGRVLLALQGSSHWMGVFNCLCVSWASGRAGGQPVCLAQQLHLASPLSWWLLIS